MSMITDLRKTVTDATSVMVAVGATDLAVEKARELPQLAWRLGTGLEDRRERVRARVEGRVASIRALDLTSLPQVARATAQQAPTQALTATLEAAGKIEETYEGLAVRGKDLVERIAAQRSTQDLVEQGKVTLARGRAVVTTLRGGVKDTTAAGKSAVTTARREVAEVAEDSKATVATKTTGTKAATKRTTTTARKRATATKKATRSAATSASTTAASGVKAAGEAAEKVGD